MSSRSKTPPSDGTNPEPDSQTIDFIELAHVNQKKSLRN
jgi:hypothetical protein